ncbi:septation protein SepH [Gordonia sp. ABSL1-1]|uniref:septation protein SepH n=1 Tax=Gordonia sp. ABSL1-1 TaxID=3053923 RepID=UPI002572365D|nr:septation protein SepH [Gordonia sp. ABSL1-1]MDL9937767.1 septation protein SepH [Gordonia sp. ABSL1-1]
MRELRVVGVESDGTHVICQDPESGEKFRIASDERLRAAARGDISRLGQIEIEMESALRPREIQQRIRAGATIDEVAALAGVSTDKIERFAHPVLLERNRAAELAAHAHPIRHDGPAVATLEESVAEAFVAYGVNPNEANWDAWKGDDGYWVVQITWLMGHTENSAHWRFQPGSHGGTVDPLDDVADELTHPEWIQPRRRLTPVATPDLTPIVDVTTDGREEVTIDANSIIGAQRARNEKRKRLPDVDDHGTVAFDFDSLMGDSLMGDSEPTPPVSHTPKPEPQAEPIPAPAPADNVTHLGARQRPAPIELRPQRQPDGAAPRTPPAVDAPAAETPNTDTPDTPDTDATAADTAHDEPSPAPDHQNADHQNAEKARRRKSRKPAVPAWEDVLLGVRSNGNS